MRSRCARRFEEKSRPIFRPIAYLLRLTNRQRDGMSREPSGVEKPPSVHIEPVPKATY